MNVGQFEIEGRTVRCAFVGCSDIIGQLIDGKFLAVEIKATGRHATADQAAFLSNVARYGGVALVARSVDDVFNALRG